METKFDIFGRRGEDLVREWLKGNGWCVVPTALIDNGGAPLLESHIRSHVLPDILAAKAGHPVWIDVKTKWRITPSKKRRRRETGCELRNWNDYLAVQESTGIKGALAFVQVQARRLLLGDLDTIGQSAAIWHYDGRKGHAFTESMIFFDVEDFAWYWLEESCLFQAIREAATCPAVIRPWEAKKLLLGDRQALLFDQ